MKYAGFFDNLFGCDLIITGEGFTDSQTGGGKLCSVVAREGHKAGIPVALISGAIGGDIDFLRSTFDYAVSISCGQTSLDAMLRDSKRDLCFAVENLIKAVKIGNKIKEKVMENTFTEPVKSDSDLSGMDTVKAKGYIIGFISSLKLIEKQLNDLENEIKKWENRIELAKANNRLELAADAEKEAGQKREKKQQLMQEYNELNEKIKEMKRQLPLLAAKERSIDPDLLEQELLMATGFLPGEEKEAENNRLFNKMEKEAAANTALSELKAKLGKQN